MSRALVAAGTLGAAPIWTAPVTLDRAFWFKCCPKCSMPYTHAWFSVLDVEDEDDVGLNYPVDQIYWAASIPRPLTPKGRSRDNDVPPRG